MNGAFFVWGIAKRAVTVFNGKCKESIMTLTTWIVTDGKVGTEKQCIALAEALGLKPIIKRIKAKFPWSKLPPPLWINPLGAFDEKEGDTLAEPWPQVIIAATRCAAAPVAAIKKKLGKSIFTIFIQNPQMDLSNFDVVIAPQHDGLKGKNLIEIQGALHNLSKGELAKEGRIWKDIIPEGLPRPWVAVLLGGNSHHHRVSPALMEFYGSRLRQMALRQPMSFLVTASRRTPPDAFQAFKTALGHVPRYIWNGLGDNPYHGFLDLADYILVTNDSVAMMSEAAATEKPLYALPLEGGGKRLNKFYASLQEQGIIQSFEGKLEELTYKAPENMTAVLKVLQKDLGKIKA